MGLDVIVLVGGKGTRLAEIVSDRPKPLALIRGKPFLDFLIEKLQSNPLVNQIILATGYKSEQIKKHYQTKKVIISEETEPLGTGGAIKKALLMTTSNTILILNGDSYLEFDLQVFLDFHRDSAADMTLCTREVEDTSRYGSIRVNSQRQIISFVEKQEGRGLINGGVYLMQRQLLDDFPADRFLSLEQECFPKLLHKALFSYSASGYFIDIGTKHSYLEAQKELFVE